MFSGKKVSLLRKNKGLSQQELSSLTGISQTYISKIEESKRQPTIGKAIVLAKALGVAIEDLLSESR